jgi:hypothetical protein
MTQKTWSIWDQCSIIPKVFGRAICGFRPDCKWGSTLVRTSLFLIVHMECWREDHGSPISLIFIRFSIGGSPEEN